MDGSLVCECMSKCFWWGLCDLRLFIGSFSLCVAVFHCASQYACSSLPLSFPFLSKQTWKRLRDKWGFFFFRACAVYFMMPSRKWMAALEHVAVLLMSCPSFLGNFRRMRRLRMQFKAKSCLNFIPEHFYTALLDELFRSMEIRTMLPVLWLWILSAVLLRNEGKSRSEFKHLRLHFNNFMCNCYWYTNQFVLFCLFVTSDHRHSCWFRPPVNSCYLRVVCHR